MLVCAISVVDFNLIKEWMEFGYSDEILEKFFHRNAEAILGL